MEGWGPYFRVSGVMGALFWGQKRNGDLILGSDGGCAPLCKEGWGGSLGQAWREDSTKDAGAEVLGSCGGNMVCLSCPKQGSRHAANTSRWVFNLCLCH